MKPTQIDQFRLLMPRQFTKLCAKCGARVHWDEPARCLKCPRCKTEY